MAWHLFYDGGCNLCHASKLKAERWADAAGQPLVADVLLSDDAIRKGYGPHMTLEADGQVLTGVDAWLKLVALAPRPLSWMTLLGATRITRMLAALGYGIVARLRYRLFGRRACPLPADPHQPA